MGNHYNAAKKAAKRSLQHSSATPSADGVTSVRVCAVPTLRVTLMHASLDTARDVYRNATRDSMTFMRYTENAMEKSEAMRDHAARVMDTWIVDYTIWNLEAGHGHCRRVYASRIASAPSNANASATAGLR